MKKGQIERAKHYGKRIKNMKYLLSIQKFADKDVDDPRNFPYAKRVFTVIRIGWGVPGDLGEGRRGIQEHWHYAPPLGNCGNGDTKKLEQFGLGKIPVFVHPSSIYRAIKLTFWWISLGSLTIEGYIKTEMSEAVIILTTTISKSDGQS